VGAHNFGHRSFVDGNTGGGKPCVFFLADMGRPVGQQDNVVAPATQQ